MQDRSYTLLLFLSGSELSEKWRAGCFSFRSPESASRGHELSRIRVQHPTQHSSFHDYI